MTLLKHARARLSSSVMLSPSDGFVPLEHEQKIYMSPPRIALTIKKRKGGASEELSIYSGSGRVYLTNQRVSLRPTSPSFVFAIVRDAARFHTYDLRGKLR